MKPALLISERRICPDSLIQIDFLRPLFHGWQHYFIVVHVTGIEIDATLPALGQFVLESIGEQFNFCYSSQFILLNTD